MHPPATPGPPPAGLETLLLDGQGFERLPPALAAATRCRYLSLEMCYHMSITKRDVDNILVKMAALQVLRLNKHESWSERGVSAGGAVPALVEGVGWLAG